MKIIGHDLSALAAPAELLIGENELGTVIRLEYNGKAYQHVISHFELLSLNSNEVIVTLIENIINEGKDKIID